ncbi:MAG: cullin [Lachnospiraceae bacterium]|nr:cullin [Lachnospiraceae bacterium]MCI9151402.1 cullin [Lachnospiraceae bacterium]
MTESISMFQVISENFFVPLASPNKTIYWECLGKLFSVMNHQLSFGVERDILVQELVYYFDQSQAVSMGEEDFDARSSRDKANWMLRRLEYYGWLEVETDKSYVQRASFKDYAVKIMKTLLEIQEGRQIEYQGYIYTIYSLVRGSTENPGIVLLSILENTDMLITGLKNLNSGIKHYIDELTRYKTPAEIMDVLFNDYMENIVDKAYHRLLTSDNVSKFRPEIVERLERWGKSPSYVEKAGAEIAGIREIGTDQAKELVYQYIHEIVDAFRNMDEILAEINRKNTQYQKAAINRAKFFLIGGEDVRGQLKEILSAVNETINEAQMELGGIYRIAFLDEMIRLYSSSVLDERSLYVPVAGKKQFQPVELLESPPDAKLRQEKLRRMMEKMEQVLNPAKINSYVQQCMKGRSQMQASELPLATPEDFVRMIYVRLYGQRKNMSYRVKAGQETEVSGYRFRDFMICRKPGKNET